MRYYKIKTTHCNFLHEALLDTHTQKNQMFFRFFNASRSVEIVTLKKEAFQSKATRPLSDNLRFIVKKLNISVVGWGTV